jgi:hypothetical protein
MTFWEFSQILTVERRNLFQDSNFTKSCLPPIRGSSWHKNEIKMIRKDHYSSNNFQDSTKRKNTEKKILGYLPRVLFFNAFELGTKSRNQVFSNEGAIRSIVSSKIPLVTIGTLDAPEDDSTCKSLLVELKVLPILKTFCGFGTDTSGTYIIFRSFPAKAFSLLNLREEKIELKVSIDSSKLPILRF